jgi:hypothetical protein
MKRIIETTEGEIVIGELLDLVDFVPTYNVISLDERLRKRLDEKVKENMEKQGITSKISRKTHGSNLIYPIKDMEYRELKFLKPYR